MDNNHAINGALDQFASAETVRDRSEALKQLFTWNVPQARDPDPRLEAGIDALLRAASVGDERLEATAALGRLVRGVKAKSSELVRNLAEALIHPLPMAAGWADADERLFLARAVEAAQPSWSIPYSAAFVTADDSAPKARDVFSELLVRLTGSVENALKVLTEEAKPAGVFERDARQMRSILQGLRTSTSLEIDVGSNAAAALAGLVGLYAPRAGSAESRKSRIDLARDVLSFLSLLLRGSLAASLRPESYDTLKLAQSWFAPARLPDELRPQIADFQARLAEAVEALALRGTPDDGLFRVLESVLGREGALAITRRILSRPGVPENVHGWLRAGPGAHEGSPLTSEHAAEASLRNADSMIARSLLAVRALQSELAESRLELTAIGTTATASRSERLIHEVVQSVRTIASMRGLRLEGTAGAVVQFEPGLHRNNVGTRRAVQVRIIQPGVIRRVGDGPPSVVLPALVEPA